MRNYNLIIQKITKCVMFAVLLTSCQVAASSPKTQPLVLTKPVTFTYSTFAGGIWQVDLNGEKMRLSPDDGIQKWYLSWSPDHQRLAYIAREFLQAGTRPTTPITVTINGSKAVTPPAIPTYSANETLIVLNIEDNRYKQIAGPARAIQYTWLDDNQAINLQIAYQLSNGNTPQQWERFRANVDTGSLIPIEQDNRNTPQSTQSPEDQSTLASVVRLAEQHLATQQDNIKTRAPSWSPTREWVFFVLDSAIRTDQPCLVHMPDGSVQCFEISSKTGQFAWSVDGRYLAFLAPRGNEPIDIYAIDAAAGKLINLTRDGNDTIEDWITP